MKNKGILKNGKLIKTLDEFMAKNSIDMLKTRQVGTLMEKVYGFNYTRRKLKYLFGAKIVYNNNVKVKGKNHYSRDTVMTFIAAFLLKESFTSYEFRELFTRFELSEPEKAAKLLRLIDDYASSKVLTALSSDTDKYFSFLALEVLKRNGLKHNTSLPGFASPKPTIDGFRNLLSHLDTIKKEVEAIENYLLDFIIHVDYAIHEGGAEN